MEEEETKPQQNRIQLFSSKEHAVPQHNSPKANIPFCDEARYHDLHQKSSYLSLEHLFLGMAFSPGQTAWHCRVVGVLFACLLLNVPIPRHSFITYQKMLVITVSAILDGKSKVFYPQYQHTNQLSPRHPPGDYLLCLTTLTLLHASPHPFLFK